MAAPTGRAGYVKEPSAGLSQQHRGSPSLLLWRGKPGSLDNLSPDDELSTGEIIKGGNRAQLGPNSERWLERRSGVEREGVWLALARSPGKLEAGPTLAGVHPQQGQ